MVLTCVTEQPRNQLKLQSKMCQTFSRFRQFHFNESKRNIKQSCSFKFILANYAKQNVYFITKTMEIEI